MKIDVAAAKGAEEEIIKSWQEQLHLQSILIAILLLIIKFKIVYIFI